MFSSAPVDRSCSYSHRDRVRVGNFFRSQVCCRRDRSARGLVQRKQPLHAYPYTQAVHNGDRILKGFSQSQYYYNAVVTVVISNNCNACTIEIRQKTASVSLFIGVAPTFSAGQHRCVILTGPRSEFPTFLCSHLCGMHNVTGPSSSFCDQPGFTSIMSEMSSIFHDVSFIMIL